MHYKKYEFDDLPVVLQPTKDEEGNIIKPHSINGDVVIVGHLVKEEGTYDEEGNTLTPPIMSDKIAVDIFYRGEPHPDLEPYLVQPKKPKHTILGQDKLYTDSL